MSPLVPTPMSTKAPNGTTFATTPLTALSPGTSASTEVAAPRRKTGRKLSLSCRMSCSSGWAKASKIYFTIIDHRELELFYQKCQGNDLLDLRQGH